MKGLFILGCLVFSQFDSASAQSGRIAGTVLDEKAEPYINAQITLRENGLFCETTLTDFDGKFSFTLPDGSYDIRVSAIGYLPDTLNAVRPLTNSDTEKLAFNLKVDSVYIAYLNGLPKQLSPPCYYPRRKYNPPLIEPMMPGSRTAINARELEHMPY